VGITWDKLPADMTRVEQAMKNWEGEKFRAPEQFLQLPPLFQFAPLIGAHALFCPPVEAMHAVTIMSLKARPAISVDQQTDSSVFTEFQSDDRE